MTFQRLYNDVETTAKRYLHELLKDMERSFANALVDPLATF